MVTSEVYGKTFMVARLLEDPKAVGAFKLSLAVCNF